jgi:hypothetical protein
MRYSEVHAMFSEPVLSFDSCFSMARIIRSEELPGRATPSPPLAIIAKHVNRSAAMLKFEPPPHIPTLYVPFGKRWRHAAYAEGLTCASGSREPGYVCANRRDRTANQLMARRTRWSRRASFTSIPFGGPRHQSRLQTSHSASHHCLAKREGNMSRDRLATGARLSASNDGLLRRLG